MSSLFVLFAALPWAAICQDCDLVGECDVSGQSVNFLQTGMMHKEQEGMSDRSVILANEAEEAQKKFAGPMNATLLPSWLQSCNAIYLDVGTNIGVQIRKLFEGHKYPKAEILPFFEEHFGHMEFRAKPSAETGLCAIGFEPNPDHRARLTHLEEYFVKNGWNVRIYPFAVSDKNGQHVFSIHTHPEYQDDDARLSLFSESAIENVTVTTMDLAAFVKMLPAGKVKFMKMDIEGAEYATIAHMLHEKVLCSRTIEQAAVEAHTWGDISTWNDERNIDAISRRVANEGCSSGPATKVIWLDDESYVHDVDTPFGSLTQQSTRGNRLNPATTKPLR